MFHHNTIRRYTLALLDFFNDVEIQYKDSNGALVTKKIPIQYRNKEKYEMMDKSFQQEISGNMEVLPRGTLNLTQMSRSSDRNTSKYNKFSKLKVMILSKLCTILYHMTLCMICLLYVGV